MAVRLFHSGERLALARKLHGFTQEDLIGEKGFPLVSVKTLRRWEKHGINTKRIEEIATFFKLEFWTFIKDSLSQDQFRSLVADPHLQESYRKRIWGSHNSPINTELQTSFAPSINQDDLYERRYYELIQHLADNWAIDLNQWMNGLELNYKDGLGWTWLMKSAFDNQKKVTDLLIREGVELDHQDQNGFSALIIAAARGHAEIVRLLIIAKCDLNLQDKNGWTALAWAAANNDIKTLRLLSLCGADCDLPDRFGITPLMRAIRDHYSEIFDHLLEKSQNLNLENNRKENALMMAVKNNQPGFVKQLLKNKVNFHIRNQDGLTPFDFAEKEHRQEILSILKQYTTNVN